MNKSPERIALERILATIKQHGGESPEDNYALLCWIQKTARLTLENHK